MKLRQFMITPEMRSRNIRVAARAYAKQNWPIVLLEGFDDDGNCNCGTNECPHAGKHPIAEFFPHGVKDATTDPLLVSLALKKYPRANIATTLEGATVVDVDGVAGRTVVKSLDLARTARVKTLRGEHHHFAGTIEAGSAKAEQLDVLTGPDRCSILPPSRNRDGGRYKWIFPWSEIAVVPNSLKRFVEQKNRRIIHVPKGAGRLIAEGERNDALFRIACSLRYRGLSDAAILSMLEVANEKECETPLPSSELRSVVVSSGRYVPVGGLFGRPTIVDPLEPEFLWDPYIPCHGCTILAGDPGTGKSLLAGLLAALVSSGSRLPMSDKSAVGRRVTVLSAEDNWARTTLPRFLEAGGNIRNVHVMNKFRVLDAEVLAEFARDCEVWRPSLTVIDTVSAYMGSARDMHRQNDVGEFLAQLTEIAEKYDGAILPLAHLNKQGNEHPLYRIVGSIGFAATVRSVLFFGRSPSNPDRLIMAHGKTNSEKPGRTIEFEKVATQRARIIKLRPVGYSDADAWDACSPSRNAVGRPNIKQDQATAFVLHRLGSQPTLWSALEHDAKNSDISEGTLNIVRARLAREGLIEQVGMGRGAKWCISRSKKSE